jgi:hypothetical protein
VEPYLVIVEYNRYRLKTKFIYLKESLVSLILRAKSIFLGMIATFSHEKQLHWYLRIEKRDMLRRLLEDYDYSWIRVREINHIEKKTSKFKYKWEKKIR